MSDIPQTVADSILVKCGRRCCVCRRYRPTKLQIHHIRERSEGGDDSEENLIATCISCHSDVHTKTSLTRRFTQRAPWRAHRPGRDGRVRGRGRG